MPRKDKCFSKCRKRPKTDCDPPECRYTNGSKYHYCRLSFTHKMNKDCVPELRQPKHTKRNATAKIHRSPKSAEYKTPESAEYKTPVMDLNPSKSAIADFRKKYLKNAATRKIGKFLRKHDPRVRSKFLQSVCSDAGVCIAFGTHAAAIRKHFDDFDNFALLSLPAKRIGAVSANGFVKELTYTHRGYVANAILKSSAAKTADNLLYEALVGFQLNKYSTRFPSFLETYGLYQYNLDGVAYKKCETEQNTLPAILSAGLTRIASKKTDITQGLIQEACANPVSMAVLIQHLKGAQTLNDKFTDKEFILYDLHYVLFQVYMTLGSLSNVFTHYDLHLANVLLYEPVKDHCIEYHYHIDGEEIVFKSPYIAKIIDYGRCYFKEFGDTSITGNSKYFYFELCKTCTPKCGSTSGFNWLRYVPSEMHNRDYTCSQVNNPSHDLRLLYLVDYVINHLGYASIAPRLMAELKKVEYGKGVGSVYHGTAPNPASGLPGKINNVKDAFNVLTDIVKSASMSAMNLVYYHGMPVLGKLHVYGDGRTPMRFVPS